MDNKIKEFYDYMLSKTIWNIENVGSIEPHIHVLTTSKRKREGAVDINVMNVPSFVELMNNGTKKEIDKTRDLIESFVQFLEEVEGKVKIAIFHTELFINEEGEYLYTIEMNKDEQKVKRYKVNRSNIGINEEGTIVNEVKLELLDVV